jgi:hypothetical protein
MKPNVIASIPDFPLVQVENNVSPSLRAVHLPIHRTEAFRIFSQSLSRTIWRLVFSEIGIAQIINIHSEDKETWTTFLRIGGTNWCNLWRCGAFYEFYEKMQIDCLEKLSDLSSSRIAPCVSIFLAILRMVAITTTLIESFRNWLQNIVIFSFGMNSHEIQIDDTYYRQNRGLSDVCRANDCGVLCS